MAVPDREARWRRAYEGKVAVVTGGASGIGKAVGAGLTEAGAAVVLADLDEAGVADAADEMTRGSSSVVRGVGVDVRDASAVRDLVEQVAHEHGRIDFMFNNAGILVGGHVLDLVPAHWERIIDVNLRGVVNGVLAAYPVMVDQRSGHIVNTASIAGLVPTPFLTPYAMTKHAVVGLSLSLRAEASVHGVRVSAVCPGFVDTPMMDKGNPPDLPPVASLPVGYGRARFAKIAYPPERLAAHVLAGVARNDPLVVAPVAARALWFAYRVAPRALVRLAALGMSHMERRTARLDSEG